MSKAIILAVFYAAGIAAIFLATTAEGKPGLNELYFDVSSYVGQQYDLQLNTGTDITPTEYPAYRVAIGHYYQFYKTGHFSTYWDNAIIGISTDKQFRYVGWDFELGAKIENVHFYYAHLSEHLLDSGVSEHFPLENRVGIRWVLFGGRR